MVYALHNALILTLLPLSLDNPGIVSGYVPTSHLRHSRVPCLGFGPWLVHGCLLRWPDPCHCPVQTGRSTGKFQEGVYVCVYQFFTVCLCMSACVCVIGGLHIWRRCVISTDNLIIYIYTYLFISTDSLACGCLHSVCVVVWDIIGS